MTKTILMGAWVFASLACSREVVETSATHETDRIADAVAVYDDSAFNRQQSCFTAVDTEECPGRLAEMCTNNESLPSCTRAGKVGERWAFCCPGGGVK